MAIGIFGGSLFEADAGVICHQVNCRGVMGAGVAKQVRLRYPGVYEEYARLCAAADPRSSLLGTAQRVGVSGGRIGAVWNLFGQDRYGSGGPHTSYGALRKCFREVASAEPCGSAVAMPWGIGCGLGGGDWETVCRMLDEEFARHLLVLCRI